MVQEYLKQAIKAHKLPSHFAQFVSDFYLPVAHNVNDKLQSLRQTSSHKTLMLGVQGTQGSGKSTLADFLKRILQTQYGLSVAVVSIDDFYHTLASRKQLANDVHPLLVTRGVPGTHDIPLAKYTLETLLDLKEGEQLALPRFDKAIDDRADESSWPVVEGPIDIVIFEGWCVGAKPQLSEQLIDAVNAFEQTEDADGSYRQYVNTQLADRYPAIFDLFDALVVMTAPSFDVVYQWRALQEKKLADKLALDPTLDASGVLNDVQLTRFISHYERLTSHCLETLPQQADWVLTLDAEHNITHMHSC